MGTPNINPRANGEGQFGEAALRWNYIYSESIDGLEIYEDSKRVATLESPIFTVSPQAPTAVSGDDSTLIATTAFVQQELVDQAMYLVK